MRATLIGYWITTGLISLELVVGGVTDLVHGPALLIAGEPVVDVLRQLGYPVYMLAILGVAKLLAALALLAPGLPRLKEWAYAGTVFELAGAAISGLAVGSPLGDGVLAPVFIAAVALASWALRPPSRVIGVLSIPWWPSRRDGSLVSVDRDSSQP